MKKMKKIFAVLLAFAMVMGMSLTTFAADVPDGTQEETVTVAGIEKGAVVKAYQIVEGVYNDYGLVDYEAVDGVTLENCKAPTSDEVTEIAKNLAGLTCVEFSAINADADYSDYTADLTAGYWVVVVTAATGENKVLTDVYNPILVGVWYSKSGSDLDMTFGPVSADDDWDLVAENAYAKHSPLTITKAVDDTEAEVEESVNFVVKTSIPSYSAQYNATEGNLYVIKDEIQNGLSYNEDLKVVVGNVELTKDDQYSVNYVAATETTKAYFEIIFDNDYVLGLAGTLTDRAVLLTYSAEVTEDAENGEAAHNVVSVTYETEPGKTNTKTDEEYVYTFAINGITKVNQAGTTLANAEFTLFADEDLTEVVDTYTTVTGGAVTFDGLDADKTYYLKETKAPEGYTLNDKVFVITFTNVDKNDDEYSYDVEVDGTVIGEEDFEIINTKLSALPSTGGIGTAVFTIGGCAIMIAAAYFFFVSRKKEA